MNRRPPSLSGRVDLVNGGRRPPRGPGAGRPSAARLRAISRVKPTATHVRGRRAAAAVGPGWSPGRYPWPVPDRDLGARVGLRRAGHYPLRSASDSAPIQPRLRLLPSGIARRHERVFPGGRCRCADTRYREHHAHSGYQPRAVRRSSGLPDAPGYAVAVCHRATAGAARPAAQHYAARTRSSWADSWNTAPSFARKGESPRDGESMSLSGLLKTRNDACWG